MCFIGAVAQKKLPYSLRREINLFPNRESVAEVSNSSQRTLGRDQQAEFVLHILF